MQEDLSMMSDEQLLSVILPGMAPSELLREYSLPNIFTSVSDEQLVAVKGIGEAKKRVISVVKEIIKRIQVRSRDSVKIVKSPSDIFEYFGFLKSCEVEEFWVLLLDSRNNVIRSSMISRGCVNKSLAEAREVFNYAIKYMASGIVLVHNHPSGDSVPSDDDKLTTKRMIKAGELLNIHVMDHVIISRGGNISLRETENYLWNNVEF